MERETIEIFRVFINKTIPDDRLKREVFVDNVETTSISAFDVCMITTLIIDSFIKGVPEEFQNEEEDFIFKNLPLILANRHKITI